MIICSMCLQFAISITYTNDTIILFLQLRFIFLQNQISTRHQLSPEMPKRHKIDLIRIELICKHCEVIVSNLYIGS